MGLCWVALAPGVDERFEDEVVRRRQITGRRNKLARILLPCNSIPLPRDKREEVVLESSLGALETLRSNRFQDGAHLAPSTRLRSVLPATLPFRNHVKLTDQRVANRVGGGFDLFRLALHFVEQKGKVIQFLLQVVCLCTTHERTGSGLYEERHILTFRIALVACHSSKVPRSRGDRQAPTCANS